MQTTRELLDRFFSLFKLWSCFLVFVFFPQDLVFRLDSLLLSLTFIEVATDSAVMVLLMVAFAACVALIVTPFSLLLATVRGLLGKCRIFARGINTLLPAGSGGASHYLLLFVTCGLFARLLKVWFLKAGYELTVESYLIGLPLAGLIYWRNRSSFHERTDRLVGLITRRFLPALCLAAFVLAGWRAGTAASRRHLDARELAKQAQALPGTAPPHIILVTFDALTAEDMSLHGYHLPTTPNIDAFARECSVFDNAVAAANWTKPSVMSLLTGKYPDKHRLINLAQTNNINLYPRENLPAILKMNGYTTISLTASKTAQPAALGISAFFDINKSGLHAPANIPFYEHIPIQFTYYGSILSDRYGIRSLLWLSDWSRELLAALPAGILQYRQYSLPFYPPELVFDTAKDILADAGRLQGKPHFIWTHLMIPHAPYLPAIQSRGLYSDLSDVFSDYAAQRLYYYSDYAAFEQSYIDLLRRHYDENILYGDAAFGDYLRILRQSGRLDDSIIIVSADHGESFGHGFQGHGGNLYYQSLVHIPLLIHLPGQKQGRRFASTVSQTDIAPTILDLLGSRVPDWMEGRSLKELMDGGQRADRPVFSMNLDGLPIRGRVPRGSAAVLFDGYKYMIPGKLYNLENDPEESTNLADLEPQRMQFMHRLLFKQIADSQ